MEAQIINVVQVALFCPMTDTKYTMAICVYLQGVMWGCFGAKWGCYQHNEGRSVCVFHYDRPLNNGPSGPYCFRLVLRPPAAADVILRSSTSSLIIVYNVCICVLFSLPLHFLSVCVQVWVHTYLFFLSAWVSIFVCSATCVYSLMMFSPEEHECEAVSEVPGVCWGWDRVDIVTAWGWGGRLLLVLFLWH